MTQSNHQRWSALRDAVHSSAQSDGLETYKAVDDALQHWHHDSQDHIIACEYVRSAKPTWVSTPSTPPPKDLLKECLNGQLPHLLRALIWPFSVQFSLQSLLDRCTECMLEYNDEWNWHMEFILIDAAPQKLSYWLFERCDEIYDDSYWEVAASTPTEFWYPDISRLVGEWDSGLLLDVSFLDQSPEIQHALDFDFMYGTVRIDSNILENQHDLLDTLEAAYQFTTAAPRALPALSDYEYPPDQYPNLCLLWHLYHTWRTSSQCHDHAYLNRSLTKPAEKSVIPNNRRKKSHKIWRLPEFPEITHSPPSSIGPDTNPSTSKRKKENT